MALVGATMFAELLGQFAGPAPTPMQPGKAIANAFGNYLSMGMNMGGFPATGPPPGLSAAGVAIAGVFSSMLPVGALVGTQIGTALTTMGLTFMTGQQIGPPIIAPSHTPQLVQLFSGPSPAPPLFCKDLADILDLWAKTWVVSGLIPGAPPIPFSGPLS